MISKYCAKIINVWDFSDPIVEVMHSEFSCPSLPSIQRRVLYEKFGNKCVKILKFWKTELSYAQTKTGAKRCVFKKWIHVLVGMTQSK
jgi:hypothetical protein